MFSVIKRTMGDEIRSVKTVAQNNQMRTKIICYNATRVIDTASSLLRGFLQSRFMAWAGCITTISRAADQLLHQRRVQANTSKFRIDLWHNIFNFDR